MSATEEDEYRAEIATRVAADFAVALGIAGEVLNTAVGPGENPSPLRLHLAGEILGAMQTARLVDAVDDLAEQLLEEPGAAAPASPRKPPPARPGGKPPLHLAGPPPAP